MPPMKKSLAHLPQHKRDELKLVTRIIRKQFSSAHMVILFGSYAGVLLYVEKPKLCLFKC